MPVNQSETRSSAGAGILPLVAPQAGFAPWRLALAAAPVWLTLSFAAAPAAPVEVRAIVVAVALVSALRPIEGLFIVAALAPLGDLIAIALDAGVVRVTEAIVVAFLAGWLISPTRGRERGPAPGALVRYAALALAGLIVASMATLALQLAAASPVAWTDTAWRIARHYFLPDADAVGAIAGGRLLEGLGVGAAVVLILRRRPMLAVWIPEALGVGCAVVAVAACLLRRGIAFQAVLARHAPLASRSVAHVSDVNAAGSYFGLMLFVAAGMAAREAGWRRAWWLVVVASAAAGLWLSGSRSADGAVALMALAIALRHLRRRWVKIGRPVVTAGLVVVLAAVLVAGLRTGEIGAQAVDHRPGFRLQFAQTGYGMVRATPWFGVGIGQFYATSPMFLTGPLAWAYGNENAHDYFLQIAAEIGLLGFAACAALLVGVFWMAARALARAPGDDRLLGLASGAAVFLLTCATGHPFLTPEAAVPFWLVAGLMLALGAHGVGEIDTGRRAMPKAWTAAIAAGTIALALSVPIRAREAPPGPHRLQAAEGAYDWEIGETGLRYRWLEYRSVFVRREARRVEIPMRARKGQDGEEPMVVEVSVDGSRGARWPVGADWSNVVVDLPATAATAEWRRINIKVSRARPRPDRTVGLEIGAPKIVER